VIADETIARAVAIAKSFLIPHARTAFATMGADRSESRAHRVLGVVRNWPHETITRRDIHQHTRRSIPDVNDLDRPLVLLQEHGYLRPLPSETSGPGRKPSPTFAINPLCRHERLDDVNTSPESNESRDSPKTYTESTEPPTPINSVDSVYGFQGKRVSHERKRDATSTDEEWTHQGNARDVLAWLTSFTPQEVEQFRREVAAAPANDPHVAVDRQALALFETMTMQRSGASA